MSSGFIALYGRFNASMKPVSVTDVSRILLPFVKNDILTIPKEPGLDALFPNTIKGTKFLQIQLADNRKVNIRNDDYRFAIEVNLLSAAKPLCIVYAVFIQPRSNWKGIIAGQLADIKSYGLLTESELYIHITDVHHTKGVLEFVRKKAGAGAIITQSCANQFEYPGIKLLYNCARQHPQKTYLYFHTKGMSHNIQKRLRQERALMAGTFENWRKTLEGFQDPTIQKAGLFPARESPDWGGWIWFNYFMAKGSYLCQCDDPIETTDRYYYESWLGKSRGIVALEDGYSSFTHQKESFHQQQAADYLVAYTNSFIEKQKSESIFYRLASLWKGKR